MKINSTKWLSHLFLILTVCTTACDKEMPSIDPDPVVEEIEIFTFVEGDYIGLWNSTTSSSASFADLPISARIVKASDGKYEGEFFINDSFFGLNDGTISFSIEENNVSSFKWDDTIPNCEGTFTGAGRLIAQNSFSITLTGTDCDGFHNATIKLNME